MKTLKEYIKPNISFMMCEIHITVELENDEDLYDIYDKYVNKNFHQIWEIHKLKEITDKTYEFILYGPESNLRRKHE
ncbi:MAG: hypothetical protein WC516_09365 [Patescibacteria group bacterium]|jgi:hypothetical protein